MKKTFYILALVFVSGNLFGAGPSWTMISSLKIPTDSTWEISVDFGWQKVDSFQICTQLDTLSLKVTNKQDDYAIIKYNFHEISYNDSIISIQNKNLKLNPVIGKISVLFNGKLFDVQRTSCDSLIWGARQGAIVGSLGGTRTFHHSQTSYYSRTLWLSEDDKPNIVGFTWTGRLLNSDGTLICNKTFNFGYYDDCTYIKTDDLGRFSVNASDFRYSDHLTSMSRIEYPTELFDIKAPIGSRIEQDIHLISYYDDIEIVNEPRFTVLSSAGKCVITMQTTETLFIQLFTIDGNQVYGQSYSGDGEEQQIEINQLPVGMYIVTASTKNGELQRRKVIVAQ